MDAPPLSPVSAGHTLRALRHHVPQRDASSSRASSDTESDDSNGGDRGVWAQQQRVREYSHHAAPAPTTPKLSARRILEQHSLLPPPRRVASASAINGSADGVMQAPLPSVRLAASSPPSFVTDKPDVARRGHSSSGVTAGQRHDEPFAQRDRQQSTQSAVCEPTTRDALPPAPQSQGSSDFQSASASCHSGRRAMTPEERRIARTCTVEGCSNYIVDRQLCFRHGGGKRCSIDGCTSSAKQLGLCWRHGGSVLCKVEGCARGVKVKGLCWGHGGGKKKKNQTTKATTSASQALASSTANGPFCIFDGCRNAPVLQSFCATHCREVARPGYIFEL
ncbi:hypothetical protein Gpo141_00007450 [Globisporangium polare]